MKEHLKKIPYFLWCIIVLLFVVLIMDIRNISPQETQYIFIEDLQKASEENHKADGYNIEYYSTKDQFITALEKDVDSQQHYDYIIEKIEDSAKNRRYAKLTLYYKASTYYTIRHNIWLTVRTVNDRPDSVFEVILSRMDLNDLFISHSIDGRTQIQKSLNGKINAFAEFTVYSDAPQKVSGADDVYYSSLLSDDIKIREKEKYNKHYAWSYDIFFMEM